MALILKGSSNGRLSREDKGVDSKCSARALSGFSQGCMYVCYDELLWLQLNTSLPNLTHLERGNDA